MILPGDKDNRLERLFAEREFRQKALFRLYPGAKIRNSGGGFWDMQGPSVVHVVIHSENTHGVIYDHELTLIGREIDKEHEKGREGQPKIGDGNTKPWPQHDHPIIEMNQYFDLLVACACDEETWERDNVQDLYASVFNKQPLDRLVEELDG